MALDARTPPRTGPATAPASALPPPPAAPASGPAPWRPRTYAIVGAVAGPIPMLAVAVRNHGRLGPWPGLGRRTAAGAVIAVVALVALLALSPAAWWEPGNQLRWAMRVLALVTSLPLWALHAPAAAARDADDGFSPWTRTLVTMLLGAVVQGAVVLAVGAARGVS